MKKIITSFLALTLILTSLTACNSNPVDGSKTESPAAESTAISLPESAVPPAESSVTESTDNTSDVTPKQKVVGVYGETEIPDIHIRSDYDGTAITYEESDQLALEQSLDSMIFETHTFGDYTVRLVGDKVRTDNEYFPGFIYAQNLRAEVEKDGVLLENGNADYPDFFYFMAQFVREFRLIPDKIGTYLDWYELEYPILVLKYYYEDIPEIAVTQALEFFVLRNDVMDCQLLGEFIDKGIGIDVAAPPVNSEHPSLVLLEEDGWLSHLSTYSSDRFRIVDSKTLIDDEAGVKYTFDFEGYTEDGHLYTAERIS